jgi:hypothetical protein
MKPKDFNKFEFDRSTKLKVLFAPYRLSDLVARKTDIPGAAKKVDVEGLWVMNVMLPTFPFPSPSPSSP